MIFAEKKIDSQRIYEGAILNVRRDRVTTVKGQAFRGIIEHNGAVAIVPITDDGNVVMVEQYRYACGQTVLEIPAGKIDKGETDPAQVAARELREETDTAAGEVEFLTLFLNSAGWTTEKTYVYLAKGLSGVPEFERENEEADIEKKWVPLQDAFEMVKSGELDDAKTVIGILLAKEHETR